MSNTIRDIIGGVNVDINKVMVIGAGQMGSGIAQVAAASGCQVVLNDIKDEFVNKGLNNIEKILAKDVSKGKLDETAKNAILARFKPSISLQDAKDVDLV